MKKTSQKGFTLVEIMVSVTIFAIVMVISMTAIFTIINSDRKAQAIKSVMDNLNSAVENMTRTIKTGSGYSVSTPCAGSQTKESNALTVASAIVNGAPVSNVTYALGGTGGQIVKTIAGQPSVTVTAPEVTIERMCFYVSGNAQDDGMQPEVIMILEGFAGNAQTQTHFNLQSTISQRLLDS